MSTGTPPEPPQAVELPAPLTPGEALAKLFLDNADRGANHANDELVAALRQRIKDIQALADHPDAGTNRDDHEVLTGEQVPVSTTGDDPELTAAIRRAQACGFQFTQPRPGAASWGERITAQWRDTVFLDPSGPCNACRGHRGTGGLLFAQRVAGDALTVLRAVCDWTI